LDTKKRNRYKLRFVDQRKKRKRKKQERGKKEKEEETSNHCPHQTTYLLLSTIQLAIPVEKPTANSRYFLKFSLLVPAVAEQPVPGLLVDRRESLLSPTPSPPALRDEATLQLLTLVVEK
jgi:hypothetical protein